MKNCVMCANAKEDVVMVQVAPATWNGFNSFTEVCVECQETRKFKTWAKTGSAKARAQAKTATASGAPVAGTVGAPAPDVRITHRQTGALLLEVESPTLVGAKLPRAALSGASLRNATLRGADLLRADLHLADLCGADLREADLRAVNFRGADLRGADLREARLSHADLHFSLYDQQTRWPAGFDLRASGAEAGARRD